MASHTSASSAIERAIRPLDIRTPINPRCELCVVIPVRDEAAVIRRTLASLRRQRACDGSPLDPASYEVILLANNCRDDSARVARSFAAAHADLNLHVVERTLDDAHAHVGAARRLLMDAATSRFARLERSGVIASTDGDTRVADDWVAQIIREVERGVDAVGGRILLDRKAASNRAGDLLSTRRLHLLDNAYRLLATTLAGIVDPSAHDPVPRHHQHFGANFAITAAAYTAVGGLPVVPYLEDVALYNRLLRADMRVRHSPAARVTTSGREEGRTLVGLSRQLREWTELRCEGRAWLVGSGGEIEARARLERELRRTWQARRAGACVPASDVSDIAAGFGIDARRLATRIEVSRTFGVLLAKVEREQRWSGAWRARWSLVAVETAITDLRRRIERSGRMRIRGEAGCDAATASSIGGPAPASDPLEQIEPIAFGAAAV